MLSRQSGVSHSIPECEGIQESTSIHKHNKITSIILQHFSDEHARWLETKIDRLTLIHLAHENWTTAFHNMHPTPQTLGHRLVIKSRTHNVGNKECSDEIRHIQD